MVNGFEYARKCAGFTQVEAADALGVTQEAICAWESGKAMPMARRMPEVAKLYGCKLEMLYKSGFSLPKMKRRTIYVEAGES